MECRCIIAALNEDRELMAGSIITVHRDGLRQLFRGVQGIDLRITASTLQLIGPSSVGTYDKSAVVALNRLGDE